MRKSHTGAKAKLLTSLRCIRGADQRAIERLIADAGYDPGTSLDYAWGVRIFRIGANRVQSHGGSREGAASKLVRLPDLGVSFAALAHDGSVERMTALSSLLQDELLSSTTLYL